jgi:hypothetical protein
MPNMCHARPPPTCHPSLREEIANALSHGLGCLLAAASLPVLLAGGWLPARPGSVLGAGGVCIDDDAVLPGLHRLPRAAAGARQALAVPRRPCGDLSLHRRQLHAVCAAQPRHRRGTGRLLSGVGCWR